MIRLCLALALAAVLAAPASAEKLVTQLSTRAVEITSSFSGERLTLFGSIEPDRAFGQLSVDGPYNVVIVVIGPSRDRIVRLASNTLGIWRNTDQVRFEDLPSYFRVMSSARLDVIADTTTLETRGIAPEALPGISTEAGWWKSAVFGRQLIRLMRDSGLVTVNEAGVNFSSETFYSARMELGADAPTGTYIAVTYVFKDGQIVAQATDGFSVRKIGLERFVAIAAEQQPLLYGVACVALALVTGWLGGVLFKR